MSRIQNKKIDVQHLSIEADQQDRRIDNYLIKTLKGVPRTRIYQMLRKGEVRVNGGRIKQTYRLQRGDKLRIPPIINQAVAKPDRPRDYLIQAVEKSVIYENEDMLVLNKPSGIVVHGGSGRSFGIIEILRYIRDQDLQLAHRLDRETSGCLLIAKHMQHLSHLHKLFKGGNVEKHYLALLSGRLNQSSLEIDIPISNNSIRGGERHVTIKQDGKHARSKLTLLQTYTNASLVDVQIYTGRTHQIRAHTAHIDHPVAGDDKYGKRDFNKLLRKIGLKRIFLHAQRITLPAFGDSKALTLEATLPEDLQNLLNKLD